MVQITPFLWFDGRAGQALDFYSTVFEHSSIVNVARYDDPAAPDGGFINGTIEIEGLRIIVFNGGPAFPFNEAISLFVSCETQDEVDRIWGELCDGGTPGQCGWLKDRFGVSWQVIPQLLGELLGDADRVKAGRVHEAMLKMVKIESATLLEAYNA